MAYVDPDYKTKKLFKEAVARGVKHHPYAPGGLFPDPKDGRVSIGGPHYPRPHAWHADCDVVDGVVTKVR